MVLIVIVASVLIAILIISKNSHGSGAKSDNNEDVVGGLSNSESHNHNMDKLRDEPVTKYNNDTLDICNLNNI